MGKKILNKVKGLRTITPDEFLALNFNTLKDRNRNVKKLINSIKKSGWSYPVFVWQDFVIDGAGRKVAVQNLKKEGYELPEIPVVDIEAKNLKEAKQKALEVSSQYGEITKESFIEFTEDLELDFDTFELKGITPDLLIEPEERDDEVPELPEEPQSKLGDLYELGEHRVLCGDSTKIEDVERLMDRKKADMVLTDPPYNVDYEGGTGLKIENDSMEDGAFLSFLKDAFKQMHKHMKQGGAFYIWHADSEGYNFRRACKEEGLEIKQCIIWNKNALVMGRQDYQWKHEPCLYGWKEGSSHTWYGDRNKTTVHKVPEDDEKAVKWFRKQLAKQQNTSVLEYNKPLKNGEHPTMKPVELLQKQVVNSSKQEDIVLDTFLGSGSTLIAAEKTGRICYGMELDPKYVDVIVQRYVDYTGNGKIIKNGKETSW
jgi:site-specific DNA-methyltransferase (adenine-specific)